MNWNEYGQIIGVNNAIRKYLKNECYHKPNSTVLNWLTENKFKHIVVLLIDALGVSILKKHSPNGFFLNNMKEELTTVFPPTTSAATTSLRNGLYPNETAWLGWNEYFKEKDDNIILFLNKSQYYKKNYPNYSYESLPIQFLDREENSTSVWPNWGECNPSKDFKDLLNNILIQCKNPNINYIYGYYDALDTYMHINGPSFIGSKNMVLEIEKDVENFSKKLPQDTGLIVIADHSQIDVTSNHLDAHSDLLETFSHLPALEPRTIAFYIKEDKREFFKKRFNEIYGNSFKLYTHDEVIQEEIFGSGNNHPRLEEFIGDYLAIATSDISLVYNSNKKCRGDHAGGLKEEAIIPLILYSNNKQT